MSKARKTDHVSAGNDMAEREFQLKVLRAQAGDAEALDTIFRSVQEPLYRCIRHLVGNRELAEDILQDVFVILQKKLIWLREPDNFSAWSYRIATREAMRILKSDSRTPLAELSEHERADSMDPLEQVRADEVRRLIDQVPLASRSVLVLHYLEELKLPEVAAILGVPLGTAKSRLAYGLGHIRDRISAEDY